MLHFGMALNRTAQKYDAVHMLFVHVGYSPWVKRIRRKTPRFVVSVFGSDFYQSPPVIRRLIKRIVLHADVFTAANPQTGSDFMQYYALSNDKMRLCRFGLSPLENIRNVNAIGSETAKEDLGFRADQLVVVCGYNASPLQQHEEMIESLRKKANQYPGNILFVFPIASNATADRKDQIASLLKTSGLPFQTIDTYLNEVDLAKLRIAADVMIQVQKTDQLSGSMQEHLFAGSVVITGNWLPYAVFDEAGVFYRKVDKVQDCGASLVDAVQNIEAYRAKGINNAEIIWKLSSWEANIVNWLRLYAA